MDLPRSMPEPSTSNLPHSVPVRMARRTSINSRALLELSGAPAHSVTDLPSSQGLADLELLRATSRSSLRPQSYLSGGGLELSSSRQSYNVKRPVVARQLTSQTIQEDEEKAIPTKTKSDSDSGESVVIESAEEIERRAMYDRFSERKKGYIVAIVSYAAFLAPFSSSAFLPSIPSIVADLQTSATVINYSIAIFIATLATFPLLWAPYAGLYGRKPIYLLSLPIFSLGSLGAALSPNLASLIVSRVVQGIGGSAVLSVGAGTISDLYPRSRRGRQMGTFYIGILIGPATAPVLAGVLTEYVHPIGMGWRAMQWLLCALGIFASLLVCLLPETSHLRGIDILREERRLHALEDDILRSDAERAIETKRLSGRSWIQTKLEDSFIVFLNPLAPLRMLCHPHILAMSLNSSFVLMSTYTILIPLAFTLAPQYDITNAAILGCLYLAPGIGNITATRFTGTYADYVLRKYANGVYCPEHRLYAALIGSGFILPVSVLAVGWVMETANGPIGLSFALLLLFFDGVGLMSVLTPTNTYCVDVMQSRSAEVIAVNNFVRYMFSAGASAFVLPLIQRVGVGWTNTIAAGLCWIGFGLILLVIRYGEKFRALGEKWEALEEPHLSIKQ